MHKAWDRAMKSSNLEIHEWHEPEISSDIQLVQR